jgi:uncharacterized protein (DUF924 family)
MTTPEDVLAFWFADGPDTQRAVWFRRDAAFDADVSARFAGTLREARLGALDAWAATPRGALALSIVLDQFPRNLLRDSPEAYASDSKARDVASRAIARGFDRRLTPVERVFLYLPFEHSEEARDQDEAVRLFETLADTPGMVGPESVIDYAHRHREVIRRFGRFPHRNAMLGRVSTEAERAYLAQAGADFAAGRAPVATAPSAP